ncbi:lipopolysaccharide biosynthesis protein [Chitinispirillales bacterium ANBcel5]|uniref:lipopolysaccharide biosynthesis protein n=1 Tax=Cellulosispirillum alkaliphilum TaxID=3039283 RepID=UPI002A589070|nr:lipopolysaccharide biosynthesis protein [Chitinispirillales bacterium ANBcel5]
MNLAHKTIHSLKWSYLATGIKAFANIGFAAVMARLLGPEAFGLVAMANVVLRFGYYFAQMGVNSAVVQKPELSFKEKRAAFTISSVLGLLVASIFFITAPLAAIVFKEYAIVPIVRVMSLNFLLTAFAMPSEGLLRRDMRFKAISQVEVLSYIVGYGAVGVFCALQGMGVWSLVIASITQRLINAVAFSILAKLCVLPVFKWKYYSALLGYGSRVSIISFLEFISSSADTFFIGRFLGSVSLGFYNRARTLVELPLYHLSHSLSRVLFPAFSRKNAASGEFADSFLKVNYLLIIAILPLCLGMSAGAEEIVLTVLGSEWVPVITPVRILSIAMLFNFSSHIFGVAFEAGAKLNTKIVLQSSYSVVLTLALWFVVPYGINAVLLVFLLCNCIRWLGYVFLSKQIFGEKAKIIFYQYFIATAPSILIMFGLVAISGAANHFVINSLFTLMVQIAWGAIVMVLFIIYGPADILRVEIKKVLMNLGLKETNQIIRLFT